MQQYLDLVSRIMNEGVDRGDRTGTGTRGVFGHQMRFDLNKGFPLVTVKKTWFKGVVHELLWMISGDTNIKYLTDNNVHIWDEWADNYGDLGPVYGHQWRHWEENSGKVPFGGIDQLADAIKQIKTNPNSRRIIVNAWNPSDLEDMALPPCHMFFQFYVSEGKLSCQMYQRSADTFLGVPFNIASYSLLTHMVAQVCDLDVGEFIYTLGDAHIYSNHFDQVNEMLKREPKSLPHLFLDPTVARIDDFQFDDIELDDYEYHPAIKAEVSV